MNVAFWEDSNLSWLSRTDSTPPCTAFLENLNEIAHIKCQTVIHFTIPVVDCCGGEELNKERKTWEKYTECVMKSILPRSQLNFLPNKLFYARFPSENSDTQRYITWRCLFDYRFVSLSWYFSYQSYTISLLLLSIISRPITVTDSRQFTTFFVCRAFFCFFRLFWYFWWSLCLTTMMRSLHQL